MAVSELSGRRKNHIRNIRHYFLSCSADPDQATERGPQSLRVRIAGTPSSPWLLPFAVNLGLAAASTKEPVLLIVPPNLLSAAARLMGAIGRQLGPCFDESVSVRAMEPLPGLTLGPPFLQPLLSRRADLRWIFSLLPAGGDGPWLYLQSTDGADFRDPRGEKAAPLFLVGLDHLPAPSAAVTGIWGRLASCCILNPERPSWPALLAGSDSARRQYTGFLEALRHMACERRRP